MNTARKVSAQVSLTVILEAPGYKIKNGWWERSDMEKKPGSQNHEILMRIKMRDGSWMNKRHNKLYKKADPARTETEQHWKNICEKGITHDQHKVLGGPRSRPQQPPRTRSGQHHNSRHPTKRLQINTRAQLRRAMGVIAVCQSTSNWLIEQYSRTLTPDLNWLQETLRLNALLVDPGELVLKTFIRCSVELWKTTLIPRQSHKSPSSLEYTHLMVTWWPTVVLHRTKPAHH